MTKINAESLAAAITAAVLAALREDGAAPAPKKAGKAAAEPKATAQAPTTDVAEAIRALRAEFRAAHGPNWFQDPAVKAEFDARKAALRKPAAADGSAAPAAKPSLALGEAEILALKARFRAEHGPNWFQDPAVKAEYNALRWAKKPTGAQPTQVPAQTAAEGDLGGLGLRALQALRKEMGLKGRLGESAEAVREQIRGARAAAEAKAKATGKAKGKAKGARAAL